MGGLSTVGGDGNTVLGSGRCSSGPQGQQHPARHRQVPGAEAGQSAGGLWDVTCLQSHTFKG